MRKYVGWLIAIALSLSLRGDAKAQEIVSEVPVPEYIITNVVDELILKDHYEYTISLQERTIAMYIRNEQDQLEMIKTLQLTVDEYKVIIKAMEHQQLLTEEQVTMCNHNSRKERKQAFWKGFKTGSGGTLAALLLLLILI